jgi:dihydrofolate reductase
MRKYQRTRIAIAAIDQAGGLGMNGEIPWHSPEDLRLFKDRTSGHAIVMGSRTFASLKAPLPRRQNIVITSLHEQLNKSVADLYLPSQLCFMPNLDFDLKAKLNTNLFYIGGTAIYNEALEWVDKLYLSRFEFTAECDTFFPLDQLATCGLEFVETLTVSGKVHNFTVDTYMRPTFNRKYTQTNVFI